MLRNRKRIMLSSPTMHGDEMKYIQDAFDRNWVAPLGENCDGFEAEMEDYLGAARGHALCLTSGTSALHLAVKLAGIGRGDIVLVSDMTFIATANPVIYEGGTPVFVDCERETWNMDPRALEAAFQKYPRAKAVILAHLYGTPAKMDQILAVCEKYGAVLIEDAAEAVSATYHGRPCGTFGRYNVLSFNGNKIITTSGGGMLLCADRADREKAFFWATQAKEDALWYQHEEIGYNYRMSNIVAGIGRAQLQHVEEHKAKKKQIYQRYAQGLKGLPVTMNPYLADSDPNFWLSCMVIGEGCSVGFLDVLQKLDEQGIESRPIWKPLHMQPVFADCDFITVEERPVDEDIFARGLCLPSDIKMTEEEQDQVMDVIRSCF